nr:acyltransferase [Granulicella aggregans]
MRVVASSLVMLYHATIYTNLRLIPSVKPFVAGAAGVDIFFVISGLVMVYSSAKLIGDSNGWRVFAERRLIRIVPMYWLALLTKIALTLVAGGAVLNHDLKVSHILKSFFFVPYMGIEGRMEPILGVGWTLNFEIMFYAVFALALLFRANIYVFVGSVMMVLTALSFTVPRGSTSAFLFYCNPRVLEFFLGMVLGGLFLHRRAKLPLWLALMMTAVGFGLLVSQPLITAHFAQLGRSILPAVFITWGCLSLEDFFKKLPRWWLVLADASYVTYLFHGMIAPAGAVIMSKLRIPVASLSILLCIAIGTLAGVALYLLVDKPINQFLRKRSFNTQPSAAKESTVGTHS